TDSCGETSGSETEVSLDPKEPVVPRTPAPTSTGDDIKSSSGDGSLSRPALIGIENMRSGTDLRVRIGIDNIPVAASIALRVRSQSGVSWVRWPEGIPDSE